MDVYGLTPYYFPTTVVLLDDDVRFLANLGGALPDDLATRCFTNPRYALAHIEEASHSVPVPARCFVVPARDAADATVRLDLTPITETLYSEQRFGEISVVVIDYDMPGLNGLDVCRALVEQPIRTVLLTGKADESMAIEAFNAGLIDHFIPKNHTNVVDEVAQSVRRLQLDYFRAVSAPIVPALGPQFGFLTDPVFVAYFLSQMDTHRWVEFYLDPVAVGLLCITAAGTASLLLVGHRQHPSRLSPAIQTAPELSALLQQGDVLSNPHVEDWRRALALATSVEGSDWLVARVDDPPHLSIDPSQLYSYDYFLDILDYLASSPDSGTP